MKLAYYPSPVSKLPLWRGLAAVAEVPARSVGYMYGLPFPSAADREMAKARVARWSLEMAPDERQRRLDRLARLHHRARLAVAAALRGGSSHLGMWNGQGGRRQVLVTSAGQAGLKMLFAELAPIAGHITLDPQGVNASGMLSQDPGYYRAWGAANADQGLTEIWRSRLVARAGVRRDSQGEAASGAFLFVPLQVRGDTQIYAHGGWIGSIEGFIEEVARAAEQLPAGWRVVFREHPSDKRGNAEQLARLVGPRVSVDNETDTFELVRRSQGVVTVNSSVGLQALLLGRPVLVLGRANYAVPGMVRTAGDQEAVAEAFAAARDWGFDAGLTESFLRFLAEEYYVPWPADDAATRQKVAAQVRNRLAGRLVDWTP
jgi:capsular polysaccharide export protein